MEGYPGEQVWDRVAREEGKVLSSRLDATSAKARSHDTFAGCNRGPPKDFKEPTRKYDSEVHAGFYADMRCILVETLIKDITTTEHCIYLFNDVDVLDKRNIEMTKLPNWTEEDGLQNIFFPHHSRLAQPVNHYHAVVGTGLPKPNIAQSGSTTVNVRIGPGGDEEQWVRTDGYCRGLNPFEEKSWSFQVAYGTATCIKLKFEIANVMDIVEKPVIFCPKGNVVNSRELDPSDWHDTTRVVIGQPNHPFKISLNLRFVESQHQNPRNFSKAKVEMFSMLQVRLTGDPATSSVKGRAVTTYTYLVTLMHGWKK
ncbi:hypothetical protein FLONG3_8819 [Fusarium longipes]|uniref:Uncharacterized protein n=1 Tax=Fusarium longipes TaxID=694270 RepID=A0A395S375_9HYPO|nr:hypothetical protein FLONG3_8819 [Fusarium longipes]